MSIVVHLLHYSDSLPLCWTLAEMDQRDPQECKGSYLDKEVTCLECLQYLEEGKASD